MLRNHGRLLVADQIAGVVLTTEHVDHQRHQHDQRSQDDDRLHCFTT